MRVEADRRHHLGGSDIAAIFGLDRYKTPQQVQFDKLSAVPQPDDPWGPKARGLALEQTVRKMVKQMYPLWTVIPEFRVVDRKHPHFVGHLDGLVTVDAPTQQAIGTWQAVHEIKCPGRFVYKAIETSGLSDEWMLQAQWYMRRSTFHMTCFTVFCADLWEQPRIIWLEADPAVQDYIDERALAWWQMHVVEQVPVDGAIPLPSMAAAGGSIVALDPTTERMQALTEFTEARSLMRTSEELMETSRERLIATLPGFGRYTIDDRKVTYSQQPGRASFDHKALAGMRPLDRIKVATVLHERHGLGATYTHDELKQCELDLEPLTTRGAPIPTLRVGND